MNQEQELALIDRCINARDEGNTTEGPQGQSHRDRYLSEERYRQEIDSLFAGLPSPRLHCSQLPEPNSFRTVDTPLGELLFTRDENGKAHAFHNACQHRGSTLVTDNEGCRSRLTCPYHAWSYGTDGKLLAVPAKEQCFPGIDTGKLGLKEIATVEKYGFIWLCPGATLETAEPDLDDYLGDMAPDLAWLSLENLSIFRETRHTWRGNWKIFAEGGLETYHFSVAHRNTIAPHFLRNTAVVDQLTSHFRVVMPNKRLGEMVEKPREQWQLKDCTHTLFSLMPGDSLLMQRDHVDWISMRPVSIDQTEITITSLIPEDVANLEAERREFWQRNLDITDTVLTEDWVLGEGIQRSLENGAIDEIQYGSNEWALGAFNETIDRVLGS
jgi:phenylpropionate dioxygenase-like ring-hydroxylating dioxygenase large terminal subunit